MKKVWIVLLLISAVIGMAVPGMADPNAKAEKHETINIDIDGSNQASNSVSQSQDFRGDQNNDALVVVLGGEAKAKSIADADGNAQNSGEAEVGDDNGDGNSASAGNALSGNAIALSGAEAIGGDATNGDVYQINAVVQIASADITNTQMLHQKVKIYENLEPSVDVDDSIFDNEVEGDDNELEVED